MRILLVFLVLAVLRVSRLSAQAPVSVAATIADEVSLEDGQVRLEWSSGRLRVRESVTSGARGTLLLRRTSLDAPVPDAATSVGPPAAADDDAQAAEVTEVVVTTVIAVNA